MKAWALCAAFRVIVALARPCFSSLGSTIQLQLKILASRFSVFHRGLVKHEELFAKARR